MRALLLTMLVACAGTSQQQLAETPTARTPRSPTLAPPASGSDKERYQLTEQFEEMRDAKQAHREAAHSEAPPASGPPGAAEPKKKGPGVQAAPRKRGPNDPPPTPVWKEQP